MLFATSMRVVCRAVALVMSIAFLAATANARTWFVAEMNTEQLRALDHARTVALLPGGILEEHGPYLPSNTDGFVSERMTRDVADALIEHGQDVLIFPPLMLGSGGANELAAKYPFPGTYTVRLETLRAVRKAPAGLAEEERMNLARTARRLISPEPRCNCAVTCPNPCS